MSTATMARDWAWLQSHSAVLALGIAACLVPLVIAAIWHAGRKGSLARALRSVAIPLVLLYEAQGLYLLCLRVRVPRDLAYVLAGMTCAVVLTFAAFAHEHHKKHGNLGANGRMMWYVAVPMGLVVAANSASPAEVGLRIILPLLSVAAFRAAYVPDEPGGQRHQGGSWRLTPRRIGVAAGLIDPADTDLTAVHAEHRVRQLTAHAAGYHRGARVLRRWHGWRFGRLTLLADDAMITEAARRVRRAHLGLASTAPGTAGTAAEQGAGNSAENSAENPSGPAAENRARKSAENPAEQGAEQSPRKPTRPQAKKMTGADLAPYVGTLLDADPELTQTAVMDDLHVGIGKAREALRLAKAARVVVPIGKHGGR